MGILHALENALGRHAELSEYAPEVEAVVEDLAARVERLEGFAPASTPDPAAAPDPTVAAPTGTDAGVSDSVPGSTTVVASGTAEPVPAEQGEPGQV